MTNDQLITASHFKLLVNGATLKEEYLTSIESVVVEDEINLPTLFVIRFNIHDFNKPGWQGIDLKLFKLGDVITLYMGADQHQLMLVGEITMLEPVFSSPSYMDIRGYDRMHRLRFGTYRRSFKNIKDSELVALIAADIGLTAEAEDTQITYPYLLQNNQTNYHFILERAGRIDYEISVSDKTFIFRSSQEQTKPALTLNYTIDLDKFSVRLKVLAEGTTVQVRGWDANNKRSISETVAAHDQYPTMDGKQNGYALSNEAFGQSEYSMISETLQNSQEAKLLANAQHKSALRQTLSGKGYCPGNPKIRAGKTIEIKNISERFSGHYYVVSSKHSCDLSQGYQTQFTVRRTGL